VGTSCKFTGRPDKGHLGTRAGLGAGACATWVSGVDGPTGLAGMFRPAGLAGNAGLTVLGKARAAEIVVNVLLPTVFAMAAGVGKGADRAQVANNVSLKNRALALFGAHPQLAEFAHGGGPGGPRCRLHGPRCRFGTRTAGPDSALPADVQTGNQTAPDKAARPVITRCTNARAPPAQKCAHVRYDYTYGS
jgi:hypothetical protein